MRLIYPDKPIEDIKDSIARYESEKGEWLADLKVDGYRCMVARDRSQRFGSEFLGNKIPPKGRDNSLFFFSRRDTGKGGPTPIPVKPEIVDGIEAWDLPDLSMLDSEWMARRTIGECPEKLFILDTLWISDQWMGGIEFRDREKLRHRRPATEHVDIPELVSCGFAEFFARMQTLPWTEGMVMKHVTSKIKGDTAGCTLNGLWAKIKWRSGSSGRDIVK